MLNPSSGIIWCFSLERWKYETLNCFWIKLGSSLNSDRLTFALWSFQTACSASPEIQIVKWLSFQQIHSREKLPGQLKHKTSPNFISESKIPHK